MQDLPNWFKNDGEDNFSSILVPEFAGKAVKILQIGAYSGDASLWIAENLLTAKKGSFLVDVDTWQGSDEPVHKSMNWPSIESVYNDKLWPYIEATQVRPFRGTSDEFFKNNSYTFSFIYVDGDHTAYGVLKDAVNSFEVLEVGGIIAFDDYLWSAGLGATKEPRMAIDAFASIYAEKLETIVDGYQKWFRKVQP